MTAGEPQRYPENADNRRAVLIVCVMLVAAVFAIFGQTLRHEFVNFDDNDYIYGNPHVETGLTWHNAAWAFQIGYAANWHPLTWLSLMLDVQLFGTGPAGPHFTNVVLHAVNAVLVFLVLRRLTGTLWPSAFVAAAFAVHPLHVESVAWVSERKDVLSGFFFLLTLLSYAQYVELSRTQGRRIWLFYGLSLIFFALGLMSKPMLVTLPLVLLLLDYWPLKRFEPSRFLGLMIEKLPFLLLSAASCVLTVLAEKAAITQIAALPLWARAGNALISYLIYLGQALDPAGLAVFYPYHQSGLFLLRSALALTFLTVLTWGSFALRRRSPYLLVGWLWYLGMLVPVIGLLQVGGQAHADRYTYLPLIGVFIMLAWAVMDLTASWRNFRPVLGLAAGGGLAALMVCAFIQTSYWRNSESLWTHTLACTSRNCVAHSDLASELYKQGRMAEATTHYQAALAISPRYVEAHNNFGILLAGQGHTEEAIAHYQTALDIRPDNAETHINLGNALAAEGRTDEAIEHFTRAIQFNPDYAEAYNDWGAALLARGRSDEATERFRKAIEINPRYAEAENNLGSALADQRQVTEAISHYQKAIEIKPDYANAHYNLANVLAAERKWGEAIEHYQKAVALMPGFNHARYQLAVLLGSRGKWADAVVGFQKILELDPKHVPALNNLAWLLATCPDASIRNGGEAITLAKQSLQLSRGNHPEVLDTLAAAYAEGGKFDEAITTAEMAKDLAISQNSPSLAEAIQTRLNLYENKVPFRDRLSP